MQFNTLTWTLLLTVAGSASAGAQSGAQLPSAESIPANYAKLPLTFELNHGQIDPRVRFVSRGPGYTAFLTSDGWCCRSAPNSGDQPGDFTGCSPESIQEIYAPVPPARGGQESVGCGRDSATRAGELFCWQ